MNSALYQSFNSTYSKHNQDESGGNQYTFLIIHNIESYFDDAKSGLLKDLVDFQSRDDFDSYMRSIEKNYYQKQNISQPPYESLPQYPPRPFQDKKNKRQHHEEQRRDFIDKVNEVNQKRSQTYQQYQQVENHQLYQQQQYYQDLQHKSINPNQNPFFDSMVNKENQIGYHSISHSHIPQYNIHTPSINSQHGGLGFQPQQFSHTMEPQRFGQVPPYLSKFVAGPTRLEANPLSEPMRTFKNQSPPKHGSVLPSDFDLKNPDAQYERYKHLMQNQYYNHNANSMHQGFNITGAHTVYQPPPPFNYVQTPPLQQPLQHDPHNMSFNPQLHKQQQLQRHPHENVFPHSQQIYPSSITLYQQQPLHQTNPHGTTGYVPPHVYRTIKQNNIVGKDIIESIGGIEDTLRPLEETLKQHELRPFQVQRDYRKEFLYSQKGRDMKRSLSECKPEHMKLVSVSPYRAVVKFDKHAQSQSQDNQDAHNEESEETDEDEELQRNLDFNQNVGKQHDVTGYPATRNSPIRNDSQSLRGQREQFLNTFNEKRSYTASVVNEGQGKRPGSAYGPVKDHQRIRMESEYLRSQREQFLNSFSGAPTPLGIPQQQNRAHFQT